jgi:hypothetical protein
MAEHGEAGSDLRCPLPCHCGVGAVAAVWVGLKASKQEDKINGHADGGGDLA